MTLSDLKWEIVCASASTPSATRLCACSKLKECGTDLGGMDVGGRGKGCGWEGGK